MGRCVLVQHRPKHAQGKKHRGRHTTARIGTDRADEAVILEGFPEEIKDRAVWKRFAAVYNIKYGGDVEPMLLASDGTVYRVEPQIAFGQDEHAPNFAESVTRWRFSKS